VEAVMISLSRILKSTETLLADVKVIEIVKQSFDHPGSFNPSRTGHDANDTASPDPENAEWLEEQYRNLQTEFEAYKQSLENEHAHLREQLYQEVQTEREKARAEGFAEGYQQGKQEAWQEYETLIAEAQRILRSAESERMEYLEQNESVLLELACAIAERVLHGHIERHADYILPIVRAALQEVQGLHQVEVRVHPDDYNTVFQSKQTLLNNLPGQNQLAIIPDLAVSKGGCVIHTAYGSVDARIDSQLQEIRRVLLDQSEG
jgi:flagellar assembly protein FliH